MRCNIKDSFIVGIATIIMLMSQLPIVYCGGSEVENFYIAAAMYPLEGNVDFDLHAYTDDGKHVGVDYTTDNYDMEISNATYSGDFWQGSEWITVPSNLNTHFRVVAENGSISGIQMYGFSISFNDSNGNFYDATKSGFIQVGGEVNHTYSINLKSDGMYEILMDNTRPSVTYFAPKAEFRILAPVTEVIELPMEGFWASWAPDGTKIAFVGGYYGDILVFDNILVFDLVENKTREIDPGLPSGRDIINSPPSWSSDSKKIVFSAGTGSEPDGSYHDEPDYISVTSITDNVTEQLTLNLQINCSRPSWAPDGTKIIFESESKIMVMNENGSEMREINPNIRGHWPTYSPDGLKLAFVENDDIYVMNADGTGLAQLTFTDDKEDSPVWSRDGSKIYFVWKNSIREQIQGEYTVRSADVGIFLMDNDGTDIVRLTKDETVDFISLNPHGNQIVCSAGGKIYLITLGEISTIGLDFLPIFVTIVLVVSGLALVLFLKKRR